MSEPSKHFLLDYYVQRGLCVCSLLPQLSTSNDLLVCLNMATIKRVMLFSRSDKPSVTSAIFNVCFNLCLDRTTRHGGRSPVRSVPAMVMLAICGPTHCPNPHCDLQRVRYFTFDKYALFLFVPCNYYVQVSNQSVYLVMLPNVVCYMAAFASGFWVMAHLY